MTSSITLIFMTVFTILEVQCDIVVPKKVLAVERGLQQFNQSHTELRVPLLKENPKFFHAHNGSIVGTILVPDIVESCQPRNLKVIVDLYEADKPCKIERDLPVSKFFYYKVVAQDNNNLIISLLFYKESKYLEERESDIIVLDTKSCIHKPLSMTPSNRYSSLLMAKSGPQKHVDDVLSIAKSISKKSLIRVTSIENNTFPKSLNESVESEDINQILYKSGPFTLDKNAEQLFIIENLTMDTSNLWLIQDYGLYKTPYLIRHDNIDNNNISIHTLSTLKAVSADDKLVTFCYGLRLLPNIQVNCTMFDKETGNAFAFIQLAIPNSLMKLIVKNIDDTYAIVIWFEIDYLSRYIKAQIIGKDYISKIYDVYQVNDFSVSDIDYYELDGYHCLNILLKGINGISYVQHYCFGLDFDEQNVQQMNFYANKMQ